MSSHERRCHLLSRARRGFFFSGMQKKKEELSCILDLITRAVAEEEAVAEVQPSWFENAFWGLRRIPWRGLDPGGGAGRWGAWWFIASCKSESKTVWSTRMLALGAVCMALSNVLSMIKLFDMPQGGSITPAVKACCP